MKFLTAVAISASVAMAAPSPEPWCFRVGMPCWKVKRTTQVFANAFKTTGLASRSEHNQTEFSGIPDDIAISALDSLQELASLIAYTANDHKIYLHVLETELPEKKGQEKRDVEVEQVDDEELAKSWCLKHKYNTSPHKQTCSSRWKDEVEKAAPEKRWCFRVGMPCWKAKRAAEAVLDAAGADDEELEKRWCFHHEPVHPLDKCMPNWRPNKRDDEENPEKRWCFRVGMPCWKAKRDLEAINQSARDVLASLE